MLDKYVHLFEGNWEDFGAMLLGDLLNNIFAEMFLNTR